MCSKIDQNSPSDRYRIRLCCRTVLCVLAHLLFVANFLLLTNLHGSNLTFSKFQSICMFQWFAQNAREIGDRGRWLPTESISMGSSHIHISMAFSCCENKKQNNKMPHYLMIPAGFTFYSKWFVHYHVNNT